MKSNFTSQQRVLLWLACSAIFFEAFDVSIVNLALPVIATDLGISLASAQWIQTVYLLSFGGFLLLGGRLCDYAGSKKIFMTGMSLFGVASALALVSPHLGLLLLARAGQGIGAALAMPGGISLLGRHFKEGRQRQTALGIFGAFAAIGFAGGLALGGMIAAFFNWHWIFGINVPVIAGVLLAGSLYIPAEEMKNATPLNLVTACWLTATLLLFCFGVHELTRLGWWVIPCIALALVSGGLLVRFDRRQEQPFFAAGIFSQVEGDQQVEGGCPAEETRPANRHGAPEAGLQADQLQAGRALGASFILGACFLGFVFCCTLSLYTLLHWDIRSTGLLLFPYSIGSALVSKFILPWLLARMKVAQVGRLSMWSLLGGVLLLLAGIQTHQLIWFLGALFLVNSVCIAIGYPAFTILSLSGVMPSRQGMGAGLQSATYSIGTGVGLSILGLTLQSFAQAPPETSLGITTGVIGAGCIVALFLLVERKM